MGECLPKKYPNYEFVFARRLLQSRERSSEQQIRETNLISTYKNLIFKNQTLCCGYSLESSLRDDSNEYKQHRVWKRVNGFKMPLLPLMVVSGSYCCIEREVLHLFIMYYYIITSCSELLTDQNRTKFYFHDLDTYVSSPKKHA